MNFGHLVKYVAFSSMALSFASCSLVKTKLLTKSENPKAAELAPLKGKPSADYIALQGGWEVEGSRKAGQLLSEAKMLHFKENRHWVGSDRSFRLFALDATRSPKAIDFYDGKSPAIKGIYEIKGSQLILCTAAPGQPRPLKLETANGVTLTKSQKKSPY